MADIQVQLRRGTTSAHTTFAGAEGEVTVDTDLDTLMVHTGGGAGTGVRLAKYSELSGAGAGGTVTEVDAGTGLETSPAGGITTTGTIGIAAGGVGTTQLASDAVTSAKLANDAVTSTKISSTDNTFKVATTEVVINEGGADVDFRVEGDTDANLLVCDAGSDTVHIGGTPTNTTASKFAVVANTSNLVACFENLATGDNGSEVLIRGGTAALYLHDDQNAVANVNNYGLVVSGGVLRINLINDASTTSTPLMELNSSGDLRIAGTLTQNATF